MQATTSAPCRVIGVGIDTGRYGHQVTFLNDQAQPAAPPLTVTENAKGYFALHQRLAGLAQKHPQAVFRVRLDAAGQYATNLETFLRTLMLPLQLSVGQPTKNANYRKAHFGDRKSDAIESHSVARFAVLENPPPAPAPDPTLLGLQELVRRLRQLGRERTRLQNQLHNLLARVFPELPGLAHDLSARWTLELLDKYPTARRIAAARVTSLTQVKYLGAAKAEQIHQAAKESIGSFQTEAAEMLVRSYVRQLCSHLAEKALLEKAVADAYHGLQESNNLESIPGIGTVTAALLTAKIGNIQRFDTPESLVAYFGVYPVLRESGKTPAGDSKKSLIKRMSSCGDRLVRGYLYNCARVAVRYNPACRALYARLRARGTAANAALGHVMRKLLHLVFAIWTSGKPFRSDHYAWETPTLGASDTAGRTQPMAAR